MKFVVLLSIMIIVLFIASCGDDKNVSENNEVNKDVKIMQMTAFNDESDYSNGNLSKEKILSFGDGSKTNISAKFTKNAYIKFDIKNIGDAQKKVIRMIKNYNGLILSEKFAKYNYYNSNYEISIPKGNFDRIISELENNLGEPVYKNVNIEDFTKEYYDNDARLNHQKAYLDKSMELLKRASGLEDIITIESKISELQLEIEQMTSSKNNYDFLVGNYRLTIELNAKRDTSNTVEIGFFEKVINSLKNGWLSLGDWLFYLISIWPLILIISILIFVFKKYRRNREKYN